MYSDKESKLGVMDLGQRTPDTVRFLLFLLAKCYSMNILLLNKAVNYILKYKSGSKYVIESDPLKFTDL